MRRHLAFLRRFRAALRIKLNATEDLLVNGSRQPEHRGVCKHLLAKVDPATVQGGLSREPLRSDPAARAQFLAGAAAISGDVGVLLSYLETLTTVASRQEAAKAFAATVARIDFEAISQARMARVLDVIDATFTGYARVQALFGLLQSRRFLRAFDAAVAAVTPEVAARLAPLRAVWDALSASTSTGRSRRPEPSRAVLEQGLVELLEAPPDVLCGHPIAVRERLLELLLTSASSWPYEHPGVRRLLDSLPAEGKLFRRHAYRCAEGLVRQGADLEAKVLLQRLVEGHPDDAKASRLLARLEWPTVGRYALEEDPSAQPRSGLRAAFCLRRLRRVWLRWSRCDADDTFLAEARLQAALGLPGLVPVWDVGRTLDGWPYIAVDATLPLLEDGLKRGKRPLSLAKSLSLAAAGLAIGRLLAMLSVELPDLSPSRFVADLSSARGRLELANLRGARRTDTVSAESAMWPVVVDWVHSALSYPPFKPGRWRRELPADLPEALTTWRDGPARLDDLAARLREALAGADRV